MHKSKPTPAARKPSVKCVLSTGITALSYRIKENDLVLITLTDFDSTVRVAFDRAKKQILSNQYNLYFSTPDAEKLNNWIK
jgi:hypothetical protein